VNFCPTCKALGCPQCKGKLCECEPGNMEIAVYCSCPNVEFLRFMRKQLNLPVSLKDKKHRESLKNMREWAKKRFELFRSLQDEEE